MDLGDVEEERRPLQLADGELAEPLPVERLERPDADAALVQRSGLGDDPLVGLRHAVEHHDGGADLVRDRRDRAGIVGRWDGVAS